MAVVGQGPPSTASPSPKPATPDPGRDYYLRKITEGKTPTEARRALKRRLTNLIYHHLTTDHANAPKTTT